MTLTQQAPDVDIPVPEGNRRRWRIGAVAAAVAVGVTGAAVLVPQRGGNPSASAEVVRAVEATAEVTSLRAEMRFEDEFNVSDVTIESVGEDRKVVQEMRARESTAIDRYEWVVVDGIEYATNFYVDGPETTAEPLDPNYELAPFGEASAAVVDASLEGADVEMVGSEDVRGVATEHYRIELADPGEEALAGLPRAQRGWFDLLFDEDHHVKDVAIEIWVDDDDLIRRFAVSSSTGSMSAEYYDFGADITITPPPPPYVEAP